MNHLVVAPAAVDPPDETNHVYAGQLQQEILCRKKYAKTNPESGSGLRLHVGLTGLSPSDHFENHKSNYKASKWVCDYGTRLLPPLYDLLNRMSWDTAKHVEERLADLLRARGNAVSGAVQRSIWNRPRSAPLANFQRGPAPESKQNAPLGAAAEAAERGTCVAGHSTSARQENAQHSLLIGLAVELEKAGGTDDRPALKQRLVSERVGSETLLREAIREVSVSTL